MKSKTRLTILLLLLVVEISLLYSYVWLGWNETNALLYWLQAVAIASIPLAIGGICIWRGGRRFSLRSMLICVAGVACFIGIALLPLLEARQSRQAPAMLIASGARLETSTFTDRKFGTTGLSDAHLTDGEKALPKWLRPLAGKLLETPMDGQVQEVEIYSDEQLNLLLSNKEKMRSLKTVIICGPMKRILGVQPANISTFCKSLSDFPALKTVCFQNAHIPENCESDFDQLRYLHIHAIIPAKPGDPSYRRIALQMEAIGNLDSLEYLTIANHNVTDDDLSSLNPAQSLKELTLLNSSVTESGIKDFKTLHLNCEIIAN